MLEELTIDPVCLAEMIPDNVMVIVLNLSRCGSGCSVIQERERNEGNIFVLRKDNAMTATW
jgi:hypothetical protein